MQIPAAAPPPIPQGWETRGPPVELRPPLTPGTVPWSPRVARLTSGPPGGEGERGGHGGGETCGSSSVWPASGPLLAGEAHAFTVVLDLSHSPTQASIAQVCPVLRPARVDLDSLLLFTEPKAALKRPLAHACHDTQLQPGQEAILPLQPPWLLQSV